MPWYQLLADMVLLAHLAFIVFVLLGGLLLLRWPRLIWLHIPAMMWALFVEATAWVCPLTPLENYFRELAGGNIYQGDFIGRYLLPLLYPAGLTPAIQLLLAGVVIVLNAIIYTVIIRVRKRKYRAGRQSSR
jgi:Na+/glutamate symporter